MIDDLVVVRATLDLQTTMRLMTSLWFVLCWTMLAVATSPGNLTVPTEITSLDGLLQNSTITNLTETIQMRLNSVNSTSCGPYRLAYIIISYLDSSWTAESFARQLINQWRWGDCYNGILFVVATQNRSWFVTFGKNVPLSDSNIQNAVEPAKLALKNQQWDLASLQIVNNLIDILLNPSSASSSSFKSQEIFGLICAVLAGILFFGVCVYLLFNHCKTKKNRVHPKKYPPIAIGTPITECTRCMTDLSIGETKTLSCGHPFHVSCYELWVKTVGTKCPICNKVPLDQKAEIAKWDDESKMYREERISSFMVIGPLFYDTNGSSSYDTGGSSYDTGGSSYDTGGSCDTGGSSYDSGGGSGGDW